MKALNKIFLFIIIILLLGILAGLILFWKWNYISSTSLSKGYSKITQPLSAGERGPIDKFFKKNPLNPPLGKGESVDYDSLNLPVHYSYYSNQDFFDEAYQFGETQIKKPNGKVYGGIIPHHLIVKDKLGAYFFGLEEQIKSATESLKAFSDSVADSKYETIILIGPNHFSEGKADIILSKAQWETPYGKLNPDLELIDKLDKLPNADIEEDPFANEHSISGLVSFIKKSLPNSKIVPIILNPRTKPEEMNELAQTIYQNIDPEKILVLASVDFSHYLPLNVANFHDLKSNATIADFDFDNIYNLEIDSPASIYAVLKYLDLANAQNSDLVFSTNSGRMMEAEDEPTTSHNFYYFYKISPSPLLGKERDYSSSLARGRLRGGGNLNFLFFGDMMLDRNVKTYIDKNGLDYLFEKLAGQERNFFKGIDLIGANLEGAITENGDHYPPNNAYDFAFDPELIKQVKKYKFNFFTSANNHFSDQGQSGIEQTRKYLNELNIESVGSQDRTVDEYSSKIIEINGQKVGMAGFSMVYGVLNEEEVLNNIKSLASSTDLVIVNIHWGVEYQHQFNKTQQNLAHKMADAGTDIIIGHHPHVVQGMEIYARRGSTNSAHPNGQKVPIFYSLGNFIFDQYFSPDTQEELGVGINISADQQAYFLFPLKSKASQISLMKGKEKEKFLENFVKWSKIDENVKKQILEEGRFILP